MVDGVERRFAALEHLQRVEAAEPQRVVPDGGETLEFGVHGIEPLRLFPAGLAEQLLVESALEVRAAGHETRQGRGGVARARVTQRHVHLRRGIAQVLHDAD